MEDKIIAVAKEDNIFNICKYLERFFGINLFLSAPRVEYTLGKPVFLIVGSRLLCREKVQKTIIGKDILCRSLTGYG